MRLRQPPGSITAAIVTLASGFGLALLALLAPHNVSAQAPVPEVSQGSGVQIFVPDTVFRITGKTSRFAFVTIKEGDYVVGTTFADASGNFSKTMGLQWPGVHGYSINAWDNRGVIGDPVTLYVNLASHTMTEVSANLPPTMRFSGELLRNGRSLFITGQTVPGYGGKVILYLDDVPKFEAIVDGFGIWNFEIETGRMRNGTHSLRAVGIQTNGAHTYPTDLHYFSVGSPSSTRPNGGGSYSPNGPFSTFNLKPAPARPSAPTNRKPVTRAPAPYAAVAPRIPSVPRITLPLNDSMADLSDISVAGMADAGTQIEIWANSRLVASVFANGKGGWIGPVTLQPGANTLKARSCLASTCSQLSEAITVTYNKTDELDKMQLILDEYRFYVAKDSVVHLGMMTHGGKKPYSYDIDWGQGQLSKIDNINGKTTLGSRYLRPGSYTGTVRVTDERYITSTASFTVEVVGDVDPVWLQVAKIVLTILASASLTFALLRPRWTLRHLRAAIGRMKLWVLRVARRFKRS